MTLQPIRIDGRDLVIMSRSQFDDLMEKAGLHPPFPPPDANGNRDALAFADAAMARNIITRRIGAGLTQKELSRRSGVRVETICRLEAGKHVPQRETILRIDRALTSAESTTTSKPKQRTRKTVGAR